MHVDIAFLEHLVLDPEPAGAAANDGARRFDRLFHHIAERTRSDDISLAGHHRGLDRQELAADLGPGQSGDLAYLCFLFRDAEVKAPNAQELAQVARRDASLCRTFLDQRVLDNLAADLRQLALERTHASLAAVVADHIPHR